MARFVRSLAALGSKVSRDLVFLRAGSLTYTTILSFVPFLAVTFSVLKAFGIQNQLEPMLVRALEPLGAQGVEVARRIVGFVDNLKVGVLGAVGVAGLFYTAVSVVGQIEDSLNHIWCIRKSRNLAERFRDYLGLVLVGPVGAFAVVAFTAAARSSWLARRLLEVPGLGGVMAASTRMMPFFFLLAGFTVVYHLLPNTRVRLRAALAGGVTAALLWQVAGFMFASFVADSTRYTAIYSGFAILLLFLMWVYTGWVIVLLGGEVAFLSQYPRLALAPTEAQRQRIREAALLRGLLEAVRRYRKGEGPCDSQDLAAVGGISSEEMGGFIDECVRRGILLRAEDPPGVTLARPPEAIETAEIFEILGGAASSTRNLSSVGDAAVEFLLEERDRVLAEGLRGTTLRSLLDRSRDAEESPAE